MELRNLLFFCGVPQGRTIVAAVHPDTVAVVATPALQDVVGVIRLRNLVVRVDDYLSEQETRQETLHLVPKKDLVLVKTTLPGKCSPRV